MIFTIRVYYGVEKRARHRIMCVAVKEKNPIQVHYHMFVQIVKFRKDQIYYIDDFWEGK